MTWKCLNFFILMSNALFSFFSLIFSGEHVRFTKLATDQFVADRTATEYSYDRLLA